jgi:hypothetical protein
MTTAALLLADEQAYRSHYHAEFCSAPVMMNTPGGPIPVYFDPKTFDHAFFESANHDGVKDNDFSLTRACRMPFIVTALTGPGNEQFAGYDKKTRQVGHARIVCVVTAEDFVVVIRLGLTATGSLRGNFVTCFYADNSIRKVRSNPQWDESRCRLELSVKRGRR